MSGREMDEPVSLTSQNARSQPGASVAEQAAAWLIELETPEPGVLADFAQWLAASPGHVEEFLLASAVWSEFDGFDAERRMPVLQLIDEARGNVRALNPTGDVRARPSQTQRRRALTLGLSAAAAVAAVVFAIWTFLPGSQEYSTARGEQRVFKLDDGSIVNLNAQSRVTVSYSKAERAIRLIEGEAMFTVAHDAARPFRVSTRNMVIQAIGTRFDVLRNASGTTVSVVEGVVQISSTQIPSDEAHAAPPSAPVAVSPTSPRRLPVSPARVEAGEQAHVSLRGEIVKQAMPDLHEAVAWRERRLVFRGESLERVAEEFNRYNTLQIRLEGEAVRNKRLSGVFDADDPQSLVLFLSNDLDIVAETGSREVIIRER